MKLVLPEAVTEDNSRLADLQERFEEVLIQHGLLQPTTEHVEDGEKAREGVTQRLKSAIAP